MYRGDGLTITSFANRSGNNEQFEVLLNKFDFTRKVDAVHMHHTWRPNHAQWRGEETITGMWRYHTRTNGWSDIARGLTAVTTER